MAYTSVSWNGVPGRLALDSWGNADMQIPGSNTIPDESVSVEGREGWVEFRNLKLKTLSMVFWVFLATLGLSGGMWNLHSGSWASRLSVGLVALPACPGMEPTSAALESGFFTTGPPDKVPRMICYTYQNYHHCLIKYFHVCYFLWIFQEPSM